MTPQEFSNEFDILYNNVMSNQAPGLDEYEKSIFLTTAQEDLLLELYNGKNPLGDSFEKTEEIRRYLSDLVKTYTTTDKVEKDTGLSKHSVFFKLPEDLWFITYESVNLEDAKLKCLDNSDVLVIPITQDDYHRIKGNPFRKAKDNRVLRLDLDSNLVELISEYNISKYFIRYLSKPTPIILIDLPDGLTINNISNETNCKLNPLLHRFIVKRAVELASVAYKS